MLSFLFGVVSGVVLAYSVSSLVMRIIFISVEDEPDAFESVTVEDILNAYEETTKPFDKLARKILSLIGWFCSR